MNFLTRKIELLDWILHTNDNAILKSIENLKVNLNNKPKNPNSKAKPVYGYLKGKILITKDFNEPLEDFKEYME
jgi:hypothetical protein